MHCVFRSGRTKECGPYPAGTREPGRAFEAGGRPDSQWLASSLGNAYRECLENGTWASRVNYSHCEPILDDKVSALPHPHQVLAVLGCRLNIKDLMGNRASLGDTQTPFSASPTLHRVPLQESLGW
jgi:hypothetical protein